MGWFRVDEAYARNPKVLSAGRDGALLFVGLLGVYHTHGQGGEIPPNRATPQALLLELGAFGFNLEGLQAALAMCEGADLIRREGDVIELVGMDGAYQSRCSTCKGAVENPRRKTCALCLAKRATKRKTAPSGKSATPSGRGGNSLPEPDPEPEKTQSQNQPQAVADLQLQEGAEALKRAGVEMPETLRRKAAELFYRGGGGHWDLQRLCTHFRGRPGVLVSVLRDPRLWKDALLDIRDPEPQRRSN